MDPDDTIPIGYIQRPHGLKGELKFKYQVQQDQIPKVIFIDRVPYFIQSINELNPGDAIITVEDVSSRELAEKLSGKQVTVQAELEIQEDDSDLNSLVGYLAIDEHQGDLGPVQDVMEMPMQVLLQVVYKEHEVMLPMNDETLIKVDHDERKVYLAVPEGLVDLYS
jgi:16S rRNA processing protein RimM